MGDKIPVVDSETEQLTPGETGVKGVWVRVRLMR